MCDEPNNLEKKNNNKKKKKKRRRRDAGYVVVIGFGPTMPCLISAIACIGSIPKLISYAASLPAKTQPSPAQPSRSP